jgi:hypothetical protein
MTLPEATAARFRVRPRAFVLLKSGRRLDLLDPDAQAWTDYDLTTRLSRTMRWSGASRWPHPLSVTQNRLPAWTPEAYARHKRADRLAAASEAFQVVGWTRTEMVEALGIETPPLRDDPLPPNGFAPWEPWPPPAAKDAFANRLRELAHAPRPNLPPFRTPRFGRAGSGPAAFPGGDHAASS